MIPDGWHLITLHSLDHAAWLALDEAPTLPPALVDALASGANVLARASGDAGNGRVLLHLAEGPADRREAAIPETVIAATDPVVHASLQTQAGLPVEFVKLDDGGSAFFVNYAVHRLSASSTTALSAALA